MARGGWKEASITSTRYSLACTNNKHVIGYLSNSVQYKGTRGSVHLPVCPVGKESRSDASAAAHSFLSTSQVQGNVEYIKRQYLPVCS